MKQIYDQFQEVVMAILPLAAVIIILQFTVIGMPPDVFFRFIAGVVMVGLGLFLFLVGVHIGLLPIGEMIGSTLPKTKKPVLIIGTGFVLGVVVTIAEPDVRVLASQVDQVSGGEISNMVLVYSVAIGVGFFVAMAMVRTLFNIPLKYILIVSYGLVFFMLTFVPDMFVPISFDAGGVTTGPMTVPFILALGVGVASVLRGKSSTSDGFGLVALASIGPIFAVMILGVIYG
ncbi:DUF1538 domain-containing protein [Salisediminibacterium halotolerans]|uniref:DUF1538 domain-containing protein n=1 Tax=Salisediminibacterium halotolerans TaxID=517425 RepID=UPI000EAFA966|nr:DUF1538 domain-containing protein [Salisediminibacterium halotolerans]RLJ72350.1 uncharacterized protein DUF1538 [Actinophytocola xinjiangensis]RPE85564.1 uncharacterized protein DUF1538 [Salisediminibacterium halotolerans]TWG33519.1 uncharacterized protein DUF1538 [Salisediminibacterium halotolerans]GEL08530.1 hypothetical protein SHA02_19460 [Salisediminibacterium halotolerans]